MGGENPETHRPAAQWKWKKLFISYSFFCHLELKFANLINWENIFFSQKFNQTKFIIIRIFILSQVEFRVKQVVDELRKNTSLIVRVRPG